MVLSAAAWRLPAWVDDDLAARDPVFCEPEERMRLAIELADRNVAEGTGGPFGAAVFEQESGSLVSVGVNLVIPSLCSLAHAEMVAIAVAQQRLGTYDLGGSGLPRHELVTSCEPCAMCFGAIPWSGIRRVACGATDEDARAIDFDEGPKLKSWVRELEARGISVVTELCRDEARSVLQRYHARGGQIYNSREG